MPGIRFRCPRRAGPLTCRSILVVALLLGTTLSAALGPAQEATGVPALDAYHADDRQMAAEILEHTTFEADRRTSFHADAAVFAFLVDHPDFAAAVNRGLGLDRFDVRRDGPRYQTEHGYARGMFWVAERRPDRVAYLASGTYAHPLLRAAGIRLRARSLVVATFDVDPPQAPTSEVRLRVHAYLQVESAILGPVLQSFGPLVRGAFESKLTAGYRIGPELSEMAFRDRDGLLEKVSRIQGLDPSELSEFEDLVRAQPHAHTLPV